MPRYRLKTMLIIVGVYFLFACSGGGGGSSPQSPNTPDPRYTSTGFALSDWSWIQPLPQGNTLNDIVGFNGDFIAVGEAGTIYNSSYGIITTGHLGGLHGIALGNNVLVAVGNANTIITSTDGITWIPRTATEVEVGAVKYNSIAFGANAFVAVGWGSVYTSLDNGVTWSKKTIANANIKKVVFEGNRFLAVSGKNIFTSSDGINWTERNVPVEFDLIFYAQGKYVARSNWSYEWYTSADTQTWTLEGLWAPELCGVTYGNNIFIAVGRDGVIYTSENGTLWTQREANPGPTLLAVAYVSGKFIAVGVFGEMRESNDGISWTDISSRLSTSGFSSIDYGNGLFIAVTNYANFSSLFSSTDGISWTQLPPISDNKGIYRIRFIRGSFYALGVDAVYSSQDGMSWTKIVSSTNLHFYDSFYDLVYAKNIYVLVGGNKIMTSPDAVTWTNRWIEPSTYSFCGITFGNNTFVAVGYSGKIVTSQDGVSWIEESIDADDDFRAVAFGNNQFVVVGFYGTIYSSSDGKKWDNRVCGFYSYLSDIIYTKDGFIATGVYSYDEEDYSRILTSRDGIYWTDTILLATAVLKAVVDAGNSYFVLGTRGIFQSKSIVNAPSYLSLYCR